MQESSSMRFLHVTDPEFAVIPIELLGIVLPAEEGVEAVTTGQMEGCTGDVPQNPWEPS